VELTSNVYDYQYCMFGQIINFHTQSLQVVVLQKIDIFRLSWAWTVLYSSESRAC